MASEVPTDSTNVEILHAAVEAFRRREVTYRDMLEDLPAAIYTVDAEGRLTYFNKACIELSGRMPELGDDRWCVMWKLFTPEGVAVAHEDCTVAHVVRDGIAQHGCEAMAERPDGSRVHLMTYPTPIFDSAGECLGAVNMLVDITDQKQAHERMLLLVREVDHRSNNLLSLVQSLIHLTKADNVADYRRAIEQRLTALAGANRLISKARWENVDLRSLAEIELGPYAGQQVTICGDPIALGPASAQYLGMLLHELCTNAVKYGALSVEQGRVELHWSVDDNGSLMLVWKEEGGPPVSEPVRKNTGSAVIEGAVRHLKAEIFRDWRSEGLCCTLLCNASTL